MNKIIDRIVNYRSCIFIIFTLIIIGCTNKMDKVKELKIEANNNIYNKQNDVAKKNLEKALKIMEEYQNENKKEYHDIRPNT